MSEFWNLHSARVCEASLEPCLIFDVEFRGRGSSGEPFPVSVSGELYFGNTRIAPLHQVPSNSHWTAEILSSQAESGAGGGVSERRTLAWFSFIAQISAAALDFIQRDRLAHPFGDVILSIRLQPVTILPKVMQRKGTSLFGEHAGMASKVSFLLAVNPNSFLSIGAQPTVHLTWKFAGNEWALQVAPGLGAQRVTVLQVPRFEKLQPDHAVLEKALQEMEAAIEEFAKANWHGAILCARKVFESLRNEKDISLDLQSRGVPEDVVQSWLSWTNIGYGSAAKHSHVKDKDGKLRKVDFAPTRTEATALVHAAASLLSVIGEYQQRPKEQSLEVKTEAAEGANPGPA